MDGMVRKSCLGATFKADLIYVLFSIPVRRGYHRRFNWSINQSLAFFYRK